MTKEKVSVNTPYDDVFRTLIVKGVALRIPFLNEIFHPKKKFPDNVEIEIISNEYYIEEGNGNQKKIETDSGLRVNGITYHVECQSLDDGTIVVRMFEYDINMAIRESRYENFHLTVKLPASGVLFLRTTGKTPMEMMVTIEAGDSRLTYPVKTLRLSDYSLKDLADKNLYFLLPFGMFNVKKNFAGRRAPKAEQRIYDQLIGILSIMENAVKTGQITYRDYLLITDMLKKVTRSLTRKHQNLREELNTIMGGKILEFRGEREYNEGVKHGREEGREEGKAVGIFTGRINSLLDLVNDGFMSLEQAADRAEKKYHCPKEEFMRLYQQEMDEENRKQG